VDPTGAGDTFAGALLGFLAREQTPSRAAWRRALLAGTTVASFCVEGVGTRRLVDVTHQALSDRLRELLSILDPDQE